MSRWQVWKEEKRTNVSCESNIVVKELGKKIIIIYLAGYDQKMYEVVHV